MTGRDESGIYKPVLALLAGWICLLLGTLLAFASLLLVSGGFVTKGLQISIAVDLLVAGSFFALGLRIVMARTKDIRGIGIFSMFLGVVSAIDVATKLASRPEEIGMIMGEALPSFMLMLAGTFALLGRSSYLLWRELKVSKETNP